MKLFGVSVASILMTRCRPISPPTPTCYAPLPPTPDALTPRDRLRKCWLSFGDLAQRTQQAATGENSEDDFSQQLNSDHRAALDELVASGELTAPVADLVQEAYSAAVYHIWRSNAPITCYEPMIVDYAPVSANLLVEQSAILNDLSTQSMINPETLAKAQAALEHDMAFYALSEADVQALYEQVMNTSPGQPIPSFQELPLEVSPDAKAAAQFIVDLLTGK
jgi:hypothetical protein